MGGAMLTSRDQPNATSYLCNPHISAIPAGSGLFHWQLGIGINNDGRLHVSHFYIGEYLKAFDLRYVATSTEND